MSSRPIEINTVELRVLSQHIFRALLDWFDRFPQSFNNNEIGSSIKIDFYLAKTDFSKPILFVQEEFPDFDNDAYFISNSYLPDICNIQFVNGVNLEKEIKIQIRSKRRTPHYLDLSNMVFESAHLTSEEDSKFVVLELSINGELTFKTLKSFLEDSWISDHFTISRIHSVLAHEFTHIRELPFLKLPSDYEHSSSKDYINLKSEVNAFIQQILLEISEHRMLYFIELNENLEFFLDCVSETWQMINPQLTQKNRNRILKITHQRLHYGSQAEVRQHCR